MSSAKAALGIGSFKASQLDLLQGLVTKHLDDPSYVEFATGDDFTLTSMERGIPRYEHSHIVAALDGLLMYQRNRRSKASVGLLGHRAGMRSNFKHDPRTRLIELFKRWFRTHAANPNLGEDEVRRMCALCRDVLNHPRMFPSRNPRSFMHSLAEVYEHLKLQLQECLEKDRTCAELAGRALSLSRNLISDTVAYLLLAATDLKQTDKLPSLEVVYLWQSLPIESNPLPARADPDMQKAMKDAWSTLIGSLIAAILSLRWSFRLFDGSGAEDEAEAAKIESFALEDKDKPAQGNWEEPPQPGHAADAMPPLLAQVKEEFQKGQWSKSGLAGAFRDPRQKAGRESFLIGIEATFDLIFLLGEVLVQFRRISDGLGDYGMIRVAPWLHPFLEALTEKVQHLRGSLEALSEAVDFELVLARARGRKIQKPAPTQTMSARAHAAIDRAITGMDCHTVLLLSSLEELKTRSSPDRLPHVMEGIGDACSQLQSVLTSPQFLARVGDSFPELPSLYAMDTRVDSMRTNGGVFIEDLDGSESDLDDDAMATPPTGFFSSDQPTSKSITRLRLRERAASVGRRIKMFGTLEAIGLPEEGWVSRQAADGRTFWHHTSLGPPPWDLMPTETAPWPDATSDASLAGPAGRNTSKNIFGLADGELGLGEPGQDPKTNTESIRPRSNAESSHPSMTTFENTPAASEFSGVAAPLTKLLVARTAPADVEQPVQYANLKAEVFRLTVAVSSWKQHDRRLLVLSKGHLHVYDKGSTDRVKTVLEVSRDVVVCSLLGNGIMSLQVRRPRRRRFLATPLNNSNKDDKEDKVYLFEFSPPEMADSFHEEITRLRGRGKSLPGLQAQLLDAASRRE